MRLAPSHNPADELAQPVHCVFFSLSFLGNFNHSVNVIAWHFRKNSFHQISEVVVVHLNMIIELFCDLNAVDLLYRVSFGVKSSSLCDTLHLLFF